MAPTLRRKASTRSAASKSRMARCTAASGLGCCFMLRSSPQRLPPADALSPFAFNLALEAGLLRALPAAWCLRFNPQHATAREADHIRHARHAEAHKALTCFHGAHIEAESQHTLGRQQVQDGPLHRGFGFRLLLHA